MSEILKEYDENEIRRSYSFKNFLRLFIITIIVILFGVYIGNMVFGKRSLDVMLNLQDQRERLKKDVEILKKYNAELQKTYFELKDLEP
ncbi:MULTISPECIES: septum formation initiator [unclassified Campylobacter]|uniref:septum formation initiator n=1 Tax=unclassified Campylobacter TaxID=2593542 RepID=UPI0014743647|nr:MULTISPECIES: septum formation initiator [unclassified Campylobacter]QKG30173.1 hypothetical protein CDOMF_1949 [Campylobacter sp. RM16187]